MYSHNPRAECCNDEESSFLSLLKFPNNEGRKDDQRGVDQDVEDFDGGEHCMAIDALRIVSDPGRWKTALEGQSKGSRKAPQNRSHRDSDAESPMPKHGRQQTDEKDD